MSDNNILSAISNLYNVTTVLNFGALFTDGTPDFVEPAEPSIGDDVTIRFRTARNNVDGVDLVVGDKHIPMSVTDYNGIFDFYSVKIPKVQGPIS